MYHCAPNLTCSSSSVPTGRFLQTCLPASCSKVSKPAISTADVPALIPRCARHLQAQSHRWELYRGTSTEMLLWPRRWDLIKAELEHFTPDIVCFQVGCTAPLGRCWCSMGAGRACICLQDRASAGLPRWRLCSKLVVQQPAVCCAGSTADQYSWALWGLAACVSMGDSGECYVLGYGVLHSTQTTSRHHQVSPQLGCISAGDAVCTTGPKQF